MIAISWLVPILLAPFIGSFVGVLIERLPTGENLLWTRSHCGACRRNLAAIDLVPVVSHLALKGRCRSCNAPIPAFHLWVELLATAIAVAAVLAEPDAAHIWLACGLGWTLLALSWIDLRHFLLPDVLTLPLLLAGLAARFWLDRATVTGGAIGAALGYLLFRAVEILYRKLRGRDGLGQGDAKLLAAAGAWVGWQGLSSVITAAALIGIVVALARRRSGAIPFGPCLAMALWLVYVVQSRYGA
jgi:leader peptidase (prepilin peptidase)/N-methyltransferase